MHKHTLRVLGRHLMLLGGFLIWLVESIQYEPFYETFKRAYVAADIGGLTASIALGHKILLATGFPIAGAQALLDSYVASMAIIYGFIVMLVGFVLYRAGIRA